MKRFIAILLLVLSASRSNAFLTFLNQAEPAVKTVGNDIKGDGQKSARNPSRFLPDNLLCEFCSDQVPDSPFASKSARSRAQTRAASPE